MGKRGGKRGCGGLAAYAIRPGVLVTGTVHSLSIVGGRGFYPTKSRQGVLVGITQALLSPTLPNLGVRKLHFFLDSGSPESTCRLPGWVIQRSSKKKKKKKKRKRGGN